MFRHTGKRRTFTHNLRLAGILSFIAGLVNITGLLSVKILTTNITGHFAFFSQVLIFKQYTSAFAFLLFIACFFAGSFIATIIVEAIARIKPFISHSVPLFIEALLLTAIGLYGFFNHSIYVNQWTIASVLLFAMGMQNSSVTHISQAKVRTTHLTGLFTDLGIELSQLFFYKKPGEREILVKNIYIKAVIISFFFLGGIIGGFLYFLLGMSTILIGSAFLLTAIFYDYIRLKYYIYKRARFKK